MHILFITDNFPPEVNAPASRTFEHTARWVQEGHKVTVITCAPNFPKGKVFPGYKNKIWQIENLEGINVIRVWSFMARNEGFAMRIVDYISFMITSFLAALFVKKFDVVIATSPQFFTGISAYLTGVVRKKPFIFEVRDLWPESIRAVGAMKNSRTLDYLEKVELFLYKRASKIIVVTKSFKKNLTSRGVPASKISIITNGVCTKTFKPQKKHSGLVADLSLSDKFVVGYIGTHGLSHALDTVVDAARRIHNTPEGNDVVFLFVGDGAARKNLRKSAYGLDNIIFIDSVSKENVSNYWSILDASIVHLKKTNLFKAVIPSKIFESMAMGIPILHGVKGESADIILENEVGLCFEPENVESLLRTIQHLKFNTPLRNTIQANGLHTAQIYDRDILAKKMLGVIKRII